MTPLLSKLSIYPVKSIAGNDLAESRVTTLGLEADRRFVVADSQGKFLTARNLPKLLLIKATISRHGLILSAPNTSTLKLTYNQFSQQYTPVTIWNSEIMGQQCSTEADQWFSHFRGRKCHLLYFGERSSRPLKRYPEQQTAFADGYPLLLISEASLEDLNRRCRSTIEMAQMRPNLVVTNTLPYAEDSWKRIRIGSVDFEVAKPCGRCILTTVNTETLERQQDKEPLSILKQYRKGHDGEAHFGQNLIALNEGTIRTGDPVEILETQTPEKYLPPAIQPVS